IIRKKHISMSKKSKQCQLQHKYLCKPRICPQIIKKDMKVKDLVNEYSRAGAFNAGRLAEACKLYCHMLDDNATVGLTLSGAMTPTGMGGIQGGQGGPGPDMDSDEAQQFTRWWHKKLHDAGYVGIAWPKEYGGRGATIMEQVIFNEEMAKHHAPGGVGGLGIG